MSDISRTTPAPNDSRARRRELIELPRTLGLGLLAALALKTALFQPFTIPSESMEPLLLKGDYLVVSKFSYGWSRFSLPFHPPLFRGRLFDRSPPRGDVVVFNHEEGGRRSDYVKRVIGLPGDRIQLIGAVLYLNGQAVKRDVLGPANDPGDPARLVEEVRETLPDGRSWITFVTSPDSPAETTGVYVVPKDRVFLMGDNRDNSLDSRWPAGVGMGFVPIEEIEGKAERVLVSWRGGADLFKPWTWVLRLDLSRALLRLD